MITSNFMVKVHYYFDELGYHRKKKVSRSSFEKTVMKTIAHCKDYHDVRMAIDMAKYCINHWNKIEKMFEKKLDIFNTLDYEGNTNLNLLSDEEVEGKYYITNGLSNALKDIFVIGQSIEDYYFQFGYSKLKFTVYTDGDYYLKFALGSSVKMKLFNNNGECLCNIVLSEDNQIFLENNKTRYKLALYEDFIGIYDRNYKYTDTEEDMNHMLADIEWDILDSKTNLGIAQLNVYEEDQDGEMLFLFSASTFLLFNRFIKELKDEARWSTVRTIATMGIISNRFRH